MIGESNDRSHYLYGNAFASYTCDYPQSEVTAYKNVHLEESHFHLRISPRKNKSTQSSLIRYSS